MRSFRFSLIIFSILFSTLVFGNSKPISVRIGGYEFSPFVEKEGKEGVVKDLIDKLNISQKKYHFEFVLTSPKRRYRDFKFHKFDIILFEDEAWEWKESGILYDKTPVLAMTSELVIALNDGTRDQKYLEDFDNKRVGKVLGYHYQYQMNETSSKVDNKLKPQFVLGKSELENLASLFEKKIDLTFVNSSLLAAYLNKNKELKKKLLIRKSNDQYANLRGLIHPLSPIKMDELTSMGLNKVLVMDEF